MERRSGLRRTGEDPRETHVPEAKRREHFKKKEVVNNVTGKGSKPRKKKSIFTDCINRGPQWPFPEWFALNGQVTAKQWDC